MDIFIVGKNVSDNADIGNQWQFHGAYDSKEKALEQCIDFRYFIGPTKLNSSMPHETVDWPGAYYPITR